MDALGLFRIGFDHAHETVTELLAALSPEQLRARPDPRLNSIAWTALHVARTHDVVASRLLTDWEQAFTEGGWAACLNIAHRHAGTGMADAEVVDVTRDIDLGALRDYWAAVMDRARAAVSALSAGALDEVTDAERARRVMAGEYYPGGLADEAAQYAGRPKGLWLGGTILAHGLRHVGEMQTIRSLLGP